MPTIPEALARALQQHQAGHLTQAEQIYRQILDADPNHAEALHLLGLIAHQVGNHPQAVELILKAISVNGGNAILHGNLGAVYSAWGKPQEAVPHYQAAIRFNPNHAMAHSNLGAALLELGRPALAEEHCKKGAQFQPNSPDAHNNLGLVLSHQRRWAEAERCYRESLRLNPNNPMALCNLGVALREQGRQAEARALFEQAYRLKPDYFDACCHLAAACKERGELERALAFYQQAGRVKPSAEIHNDLGVVLHELGRREQAVAQYQEALRLKPGFDLPHVNLGSVYLDLGRFEEAIAQFRTALTLNPRSELAHNNLGVTYKKLGRLRESVAEYEEALFINPTLADTHNNMGSVLAELGQLARAVAHCRQALRLKPSSAESANSLAKALAAQGKMDEAADAFRLAFQLRPAFTSAHSNFLLCTQYRMDVTPTELADLHAAWDKQHGQPLRNAWRPFDNDRDPKRRLRLGFVSGDLCRHPVGYYVVRTFEALDSGQCELVFYSDRIDKDDLSARVAATGTWRDAFATRDEELAELIRADRIDILFDLAGHTAKNRLLVFARKPAPVQITWLGYVGPTGLSAIDYLIADRILIPEERPTGSASGPSEKVLYMPDAHICYCPPGPAPAVGPLPALAAGHVTFGCFNNLAKVSPLVVKTFSAVLTRAPGSRLILKYRGFDDEDARRRFTQAFAGQGIDAGRLELQGWSALPEMFVQYERIDIALDPFPFTGGATTCLALWMGLPVVTLPGPTFASRQSLSLLTQVGKTETAARDLTHYVDIAVGLSEDLPRLAEIRAALRPRMEQSPLCDAPRFASHFLAKIREVWQAWCALK